ncbi:hypothetical protein T492DRAFT_918288 [Pavlovales sp. CCMP2436]|nr:hypothetical protein T492DRAFT_918288 [Pavlovales sp. CCMP2436]
MCVCVCINAWDPSWLSVRCLELTKHTFFLFFFFFATLPCASLGRPSLIFLNMTYSLKSEASRQWVVDNQRRTPNV